MNKLLLVAAAGLSIAALSSPASAADGTITINGQVNSVTCTINAATSANFTVTLPTVSTNALKVAGNTAGSTPFNITLSGCGALTKATTYFEPGVNTDFTSGDLKNTGAATNVQVRLLNSNLSKITMGGSAGSGAGTQGSTQFDLTGGAGTLSYVAQYVATGVAGAGSVATNVQYTVIYQ